MEKYKIIRFYKKKGPNGLQEEIIRRDVTLKEAQEWCSREDTEKAGVWFDGYQKQ